MQASQACVFFTQACNNTSLQHSYTGRAVESAARVGQTVELTCSSCRNPRSHAAARPDIQPAAAHLVRYCAQLASAAGLCWSCGAASTSSAVRRYSSNCAVSATTPRSASTAAAPAKSRCFTCMHAAAQLCSCTSRGCLHQCASGAVTGVPEARSWPSAPCNNRLQHSRTYSVTPRQPGQCISALQPVYQVLVHMLHSCPQLHHSSAAAPP
jgi:hypothetical protein